MVTLHAADSATHLGGPSIVGFAIAVAGVGLGALLVFGMPGARRRREDNRVVNHPPDDNTDREA